MKVLIPHDEVEDLCARLGKQITQDYYGKVPVIVCVLKGAALFHAELVKNINLDVELDYMQVSSYVGKESSGIVTFKKDIETDIKGRDVIFVEDLIDSGRTMAELKEIYLDRGANSIEFATMLDKPFKRKTPLDVKYVGKEIDDLFVVGYGMDLDGKYRNLKDICIYED